MNTFDKIIVDGQEVILPEELSDEEMDDFSLLEEEPTIDLTQYLEVTQEIKVDINEQ